MIKDTSSTVYDLYQQMYQENIISTYHGEFSQQVVNMFLKQARLDLSLRCANKITFKRTYHVLVECLENILKHTAQLKNHATTRNEYEGIIVLSSTEDDYRITVGNLVNLDDQESLTKKIESINALNLEELKALHAETLKNGVLSEKNGAGLGLIEIAVRSRNKLLYEFFNFNEKFTFFTLQTVISQNKQQ